MAGAKKAGGRGGAASHRFPNVKGSAQVDPKKGAAMPMPMKGAGKMRMPKT